MRGGCLGRFGVVLGLQLLGCADPCHEGPGVEAAEGGAEHVRSTLAAAEGRVAVDVRWPAGGDSFTSFPVAVIVPGAFSATEVADGAALAQPQTHDGIVSVHVDLAGPDWGGGEDDRRGPLARAAVAAALRFAAGRLDDGDRCSITAREPRADPDRVVLVGVSNGGNLAAATLTDPTLDLPPLAGLTVWETPAGAEFVGLEHGADARLYAEGTCVRGEEGISCPFGDAAVVAGPAGTPCFDLDGDSVCGEEDHAPPGVVDPETGAVVYSPALTRLAAPLGLPDLATPEEAVSFWRDRDAAQAAPALVAAWPALPVLLLATDTDHVLHGLGDHPHVTGLGEALQAAGAAWVRLNPGSTWSGYAQENAVNAPLRLTEAPGWLFPEDSAREDELSAAIRELAAGPGGG